MLQPNIRTRAMLVTAALSATLAASGCAAPQSKGIQSLDTTDGFGDASQQTFAAQIKNPNPVYDHRMESSGARATQALERYRTDTVKQPTTVRTSNLAVGSSGSSASSAANVSPNSASSSAPNAEGAGTTSSVSTKSQSANTTLRRSDSSTFIPAAGGAIDPATGKFYPSAGPNGYTDPVTGEFISSVKVPLNTTTFIPAAGGAIDPATGKFYPSAGPNGYTDPVTGEFISKP